MVVLLTLVDGNAQLQQHDAVGEVGILQEELVERRELELQALEALNLIDGMVRFILRFICLSDSYISWRAKNREEKGGR